MTQEYYSADVAHKYAEEIIAAQMSNSLKEVFRKFITPAINYGQFQVIIPQDELAINVQNYLKDLGYTIEYRQCGMLEYEYIVKW